MTFCLCVLVLIMLNGDCLSYFGLYVCSISVLSSCVASGYIHAYVYGCVCVCKI